MRLFLIVATLFCALALDVNAQTKPDPRVIEVSGSAERLITPNEFTFKVTIVERIDKKEKITIEQQEASLRTELQKIGIDAAKDLSIYDVYSNYIPRKKVRDVLGTKDYRLKIRDINKIAPLIGLVDSLNIAKLDLIDTDHSEITQLRRETKMDAIKAAKEKADYLLGAIGERAGKPVFVKEVEEGLPRFTLDGASSNTVVSNIRSTSSSSHDNDDSLSFSPIRLRYVIQAKFEIN